MAAPCPLGVRVTSTPAASPQRPPRSARVRTFEALANPIFRRVWTLGIFYYTYRATELAVLSWFVLTLTGSDLAVALVGVSRVAPMFLFGLVAGNLADRFARRRLMVGAQTVNLSASLVMVVLLSTGHQVAWMAYLMIFITGTTWAVDYAARRALLGDIFTGRVLTNATFLDAGLVTGSNMVGPLVGTTLIRYTGFTGAYVGIALLMLMGLALVLSIRVNSDQTRTVSRGPVGQQLRAATSIMRTNRTVLGAVLLTAAFNFFGFPFVQLVSVVARDVMGLQEVAFGLLVSALGFGALMGSAIIASRDTVHKGNYYSLGAALLMVMAVLFAWAPWYPLALAAMVVAGLGLAAFAGMQPVIPLEAVTPQERGRAMGAIALGIGAQAPGTFLMGLLAELAGPREAITIVTLAGLMSVVVLRRIFPALADAADKATARRSG